MRKKHIIKLTENQVSEAEENTFSYLSNGDFKEYNGQSEISVTGKQNDEKWGNPKTSDNTASKISPQTYLRYSNYAFRPHSLREDSSDTNSDGVDDYYNNPELDTLGNGNHNDDLVKIPEGVQRKVNILISALKPLQAKQQAIVINKIIESFDFSELPYSWLKELRLKINAKKTK